MRKMERLRKIIVFIAKAFAISFLYVLALVSFGCLITGMGIMDVKGLYGIDAIAMFLVGVVGCMATFWIYKALKKWWKIE